MYSAESFVIWSARAVILVIFPTMRVLLHNWEKISNIVTLTRLQIFFCQNHLIDRLNHLLSGRVHLHLNAMSVTCEGLYWIFKAIFSFFFEFSKILFCRLLSSVGHAIPLICLKYTPTCFFGGLSKEQWLVNKLMYHFRNKFLDHFRRQFFGRLTDACGQKWQIEGIGSEDRGNLVTSLPTIGALFKI